MNDNNNLQLVETKIKTAPAHHCNHDEVSTASMFDRLRDTIPSNKVTIKDITLLLMLVYIAMLHFGHHDNRNNGQTERKLPTTAVEHVFVPEPMKLLDFNEKLSKLDKQIKNKIFDEKEEDDTISGDHFTEQENFDDVNSFEKISKNLEDHSCATEQQREDRN